MRMRSGKLLAAFVISTLVWPGQAAVSGINHVEVYIRLARAPVDLGGACAAVRGWSAQRADSWRLLQCVVMRGDQTTLRLRWQVLSVDADASPMAVWLADGRLAWFEQLGRSLSHQSLEAKQGVVSSVQSWWSSLGVAPFQAGAPSWIDPSARRLQQFILIHPPLEPIVVAVIDSGVNFDSPLLAPLAWRNEREVAGNGTDDDANGFVDDVEGWDFVDDGVSDPTDDRMQPDNLPRDLHGHGTVVASILAATLGPVAREVVRILPVRVASGNLGSGTASPFAVAEGIRYAVQQRAAVINLSIASAESYRVVEEAIAHAINSGITVVAAAGNSGAEVMFPARLPGVVAVGALDTAGSIWPRSARGPEVSVFAPGVEMLDAFPWIPSHLARSGTSYAAPGVAARAAMLRAVAATGEPNCPIPHATRAPTADALQVLGAWVAAEVNATEGSLTTQTDLANRWRDSL
jgi:hypothetical protein